MSALRRLSRPAMEGLAAALDSGRVGDGFQSAALRRVVPEKLVGQMREELRELGGDGFSRAQIARMLRLLAEERGASQAIADRVELVWSGTDPKLGSNRDTAVVVQELFREARRRVLIASYALDSGAKSAALFGALAARMDDEPELKVRLFANVHRKHGDDTAESVLLREFAESFREKVWPGERLPDVFFDPRSLAVSGAKRACLHAKCIVVDDSRALVTSANFTEAAHERNIEAGAVVADKVIARALKAQFEVLVDRGALVRVPGL